jgi:hypothetical protein
MFTERGTYTRAIKTKENVTAPTLSDLRTKYLDYTN